MDFSKKAKLTKRQPARPCVRQVISPESVKGKEMAAYRKYTRANVAAPY